MAVLTFSGDSSWVLEFDGSITTNSISVTRFRVHKGSSTTSASTGTGKWSLTINGTKKQSASLSVTVPKGGSWSSWYTFSASWTGLSQNTSYSAKAEDVWSEDHFVNHPTTFKTLQSSYTVTISHWTFGWKNGEGNNGDKTAYNLDYTTFSANAGSSVTFNTSRGISYPRGFYLSNSCSHSSYNNGTWRSYDMPVTLTQPSSDTGMQYSYPMVNYNINYKLNGGTNNANNPSTYTVAYGVTLQNPTRTGYNFAGWDITYHPDNIVAAATTSNYHWLHMHSAVVPGITYKVHVGKAWVTAGSASRFSVIIYDFTSSTALTYFELPFGEDINFEITCPSSADISHRINLICYTGLSGQTANIGVTWEDIFITANNCNLINRGVNIASFSSVSELNSVVSADFRDINPISCEAKWIQAEAYLAGPIPGSGNCLAVDYIESTGTQYIDSGINPVTYDSHLSIEIDFELTVEDSSYHSILASSYGDNNGTWSWSSQFNFGISNSNVLYVELPGGTGTTANRANLISSIKARKQRHKVWLFSNVSGAGIVVDGAYKWQSDTGITGGPNKNLYIFTRSYVNEGQYTAASYTTSMKLYSLRIKNTGGLLLRDFVPCYKVGSGAGLWDKVSKQFFGNIGTGTFKYPEPTKFIKGKVFYKTDGAWVPAKRIFRRDSSGGVPLSTYTRVGYLQSSGTQYINTGVSDANGIKVKAKIAWDSFDGNYETLCGAQDATSSMANGANSLIMQYNVTPTYAWYIGNANNGGNHAKFTLDYKPHTIEVSSIIGNSYMKIDDDIQYSSISTTRGTQPIYLFALNNGGSPGYYGSGKIYRLKMYDSSNTLVRDFVPVKRKSDSVMGMYDIVNGVFYTNQGTGTFTNLSTASYWEGQ